MKKTNKLAKVNFLIRTVILFIVSIVIIGCGRENEQPFINGQKDIFHPTTVCGIFLCSSENVINVVREIGLTNSYQLTQYSAYALINIVFSRDQNDVLMSVGSTDVQQDN